MKKGWGAVNGLFLYSCDRFKKWSDSLNLWPTVDRNAGIIIFTRQYHTNLSNGTTCNLMNVGNMKNTRHNNNDMSCDPTIQFNGNSYAAVIA